MFYPSSILAFDKIAIFKLNAVDGPFAGADPGFSVGGGANPPGESTNLWCYQKFPKNRMKLRKFWAVRGGLTCWGHPAHGSATDLTFWTMIILLESVSHDYIITSNDRLFGQSIICTDIFHIDTSSNACYHQAHWLIGIPYLSIITSNEWCWKSQPRDSSISHGS